MEKHYVSARGRSLKGVLVFLARDAEQRVPRYASAAVAKAERAGEIPRFVEFCKQQTSSRPAELVFGSPPLLADQSTVEIEASLAC